jgi:glycosyltransferase involved in cell wall biosynthesis
MSRQGADDPPQIRTLLVVPWDAERGGVVSVAENLTRYLQARGHHVMFFHPGTTLFLRRRPTKLGFDGAKLRLVLPYGERHRLLRAVAFPLLFALALVQLMWFLRRHRIQIINLHYVEDGYFYFGICRRLLPVRLVTSIHGRDAFYREKPRVSYSRAFRFLIDSSDLIVLPSSSYLKKLLQAFPDIQNKVLSIHNGINPVQFGPVDEAQRERAAIQRYILCVAELRDYKGIDILLHAVKPVLASDDTLRMVLAGDGPLRGELEELAASLGIDHRTQFLGTKGAAEIAALMRGCELLVLPSREEPFGIVLIEAMACRTPVVASDVGGIPEIVEHERSGILVEPENPRALTEGIRRLLADRNLRITIAENGYRRVMERFCFFHTGAAYESALASVLGIHLTESIAA